MKKVLKFPIFMLLALLLGLAAFNAANAVLPPGTGKVNVTVTYKTLTIICTNVGQTVDVNATNPTLGFQPPFLSECTVTDPDGTQWKVFDLGGSTNLNFKIEGSPGIPVNYSIEPDYIPQADIDKVRLMFPDVSGGLNGITFAYIPNSSSIPAGSWGHCERLSTSGFYYIRLRFNQVLLQYGVLKGTRTFPYKITVDY
jgi:hypothetical protein